MYISYPERGTFVETAIVDYHVSFADQGEQSSVFNFRLQQTNRNIPFPFSVAAVKWKLPFAINSDIYYITTSWKHGDMDKET